MCDIYSTNASKTLSNFFFNLLSYIMKFVAIKIKQRLLRNLRDIYFISFWRKNWFSLLFNFL